MTIKCSERKIMSLLHSSYGRSDQSYGSRFSYISCLLHTAHYAQPHWCFSYPLTQPRLYPMQSNPFRLDPTHNSVHDKLLLILKLSALISLQQPLLKIQVPQIILNISPLIISFLVLFKILFYLCTCK